jgi:meso-butanediol dehydrogenase/(S,S)-butanediol dehydrogenase/diacetyl reductase
MIHIAGHSIENKNIFKEISMNTSGRLKGKVAIITGAACGIGRATADLFAREGAKLVLADINEQGLEEIVSLIEKKGGTAISSKTDVADEDEIRALISLAIDTFSHVDILCNNAGTVGDLAPPEKQDAQVWRNVLDVNLMGVVYATKHIVQHMKERNGGAIVNTSSVAGIRSGAGGNAYSASKAALINYTQTTACDLGEYNIRVNAVCPGLIETGMTKPVFDYARETGKESKLGARCELKRYGNPEEVAATILFFASDEASYITGQALPVDGGNTASLNLPGMKF